VATLVVLQGPDKGRVFTIDDAPAVLGRDSEHISLSDRTVSRHHARLRPDQEFWVLEDLRSANGTYLNNTRVRGATRLKHGDQIKIGATLLVYSGDASMPPVGRAGPVRDRIDLDVTSANLDSAILSSIASDESVIIAGPELTEAARAWRVMSELTSAIGAMIDPEQLLERVMDLIFEELPVDRGFILLYDREGEDLVPHVVRYRRGLRTQQGKVTISKRIIQHVLDHRESVLCTNAMTDKRFATEGAEDSIHDFGLQSVICAPIMARDLLMGVLHIDCTASAHSYTQEQLRLMSAIGQMTGLVIQNARLVQQQMKTTRLVATGETVAYLSHSIKNILQGMQAGADVVNMALDKQDFNMLSQGWGMIQRNLERIMKLTMNMLSFSKDRQPSLRPSHLNQIVAEAVASLQKKAEEHQIRLVTEFEQQMPPIPLDPDGISQVALNLIDNAIESVEPQNGVVHVTTEFHPEEGIADIIVVDNGPGIEPDRVEEIFEPFTSSKGQAGTGLGLPVARKIVREHHGRTVVESQPGEGTTFRIRLPAQQRFRESEKTVSTPG